MEKLEQTKLFLKVLLSISIAFPILFLPILIDFLSLEYFLIFGGCIIAFFVIMYLLKRNAIKIREFEHREKEKDE